MITGKYQLEFLLLESKIYKVIIEYAEDADDEGSYSVIHD
jgi:hypothetical protein